MKMEKIVDTAYSLEYLKMDSGLLPKPNDGWFSFVPKKGDIAYVLPEDRYEFDGSDWVRKEKAS
jgi:hypothetical protein